MERTFGTAGSFHSWNRVGNHSHRYLHQCRCSLVAGDYSGFSAGLSPYRDSLVEGDYREIEDWIAEGKIDCGFLSLPTSDTFDAIPLHQDPMLVLSPLEHPLSSEDSISLSQIENEPFIMPSQGSDYDVNRMLVKARIKPDIKYTLGDDYAIMAMVEKGLGISILPELVCAEYTADRIEGEELQIARHCRNPCGRYLPLRSDS